MAEDAPLKPLELGRADIGFGKVRIDDAGVHRIGPLRRDSLVWDDILDYRLTIELVAKEVAQHPNTWGFLPDLWIFFAGLVRGLRGERSYRLGIALIGRTGRVAFNWRFAHATAAIEVIVERLRPRLLAVARDELAATGEVRFGALAVSADHLRWRDQRVMAGAVESIELIDSSPVQLAIRVRTKAWPHVRLDTADIPNLHALLAIAEELGYRVRGRELLEAIEPIAASRGT